jgi:hypothetical protein
MYSIQVTRLITFNHRSTTKAKPKAKPRIYTKAQNKSKMSKSVVLSVPDWNVNEVKYMTPKLNDKGGKSINIISKQTNRALSVSTPLMMTWGIADFVDEKGEPDGKFSMSLNFPSTEYSTPQLDLLLDKVKAFENQLLDDAVKNSESWFGESMSREVVKHMFFPILKYSKNKDTKKIDLTKPPSLRAKVPNYGGKWNVEVYDTASNLLFPSDDPLLTPLDFVPKRSNVAVVLGVSQLWVGGKGWGCTVKMIQCIVKPQENVSSVQGRCHIELSDEDKASLGNDNYIPVEIVPETSNKQSTIVDDSDDEEDVVPAPTPTPVAVAIQEPVVVVSVSPPVVSSTDEVPKKKMVVKKKVVV